MIRVHRGEEPAALREIRDRELRRVRALVGRPTEADLGDRYQIAKERLWEAQGYKCAYCESKEQLKRNDAEHLRPKSRADRRPGALEDHGYWWLAWTWEDLFFGCRNCNQAPAKLDQFPLDQGSFALVPEEAPPGRERPLLLDPAEDSGIDHIQFRGSMVHGEERWTPTARAGSRRGDATIRACMLDRPDLITAYSAHVRDLVKREIAPITAALEAAEPDPAEVWEAWECALFRLLSPEQPYVGLSYDALDHLFPMDLRVRWGLVLRKPQ